MTQKIAREIEALKSFSEKCKRKAAQPLDFTGCKPSLVRVPSKTSGHWWTCQGYHPAGFDSFGVGITPQDAYENWVESAIPF